MSTVDPTDPGEHPAVRTVMAALAGAGVRGQVLVLDEPAPTAAAAAELLGCDVGAIANSLVFLAREPAGRAYPLLVLTSGAHRVDTIQVAAVLGLAALERADPAAVRAATGQVIGGVAPVGHPRPVRTVVDTALAVHDVVWAAAGHARTVFPTSYDELLRITGGTASDVT